MAKDREERQHHFEELSRKQLSGTTLQLYRKDKRSDSLSRQLQSADPASQTSTSGRTLEVDFPLSLRLAGVKGGGLDLQLQLLTFKCGSHCDLQPSAQIPVPDSLHDAGRILGTAASLAFLRLTFPEQMPQVQRWLVRIGTAQAAQIVATAAVQNVKQQTRHTQQAVGQRQLFRIPFGRDRRPVPGAALACGARFSQLASSAALMAAAAFLWRQIHPTSHQLLQAIVVAIELSSGYAETKRKAATGRIRTGPQLEAAWRRRHKWAAQKAGRVLTDSYSSPPLKPFLSAAQKLSIGMLLLVTNPTGSQQPLTDAQQTTGVASSWSAPGRDSSWLLSLSYPIRQPTALAGEDGKRTAQDLAEEAPIDRGTAGRKTPAPASKDHKPSMANAQDKRLESGSVGEDEAEPYFQPSAAEDLKTGFLPTICSMEDIKKYKERAARGDEDQVVSPFAGSHTDPQTTQPGQIKLFSTEELVGMDPGINQPGGHNQRDELMEGCNLALYGRGDHLTEEVLTLRDKQKMTFRAFFLMAVFLPFLLLGPILIYLSQGKAAPAEANPSDMQGDSLIGESLSEEEDKKEAGSKESSSNRMRLAAYHLLLWGIRCGGAAFIKWGQWSATREDMFPPELCNVLAELHDQAPTHSWAESKREIERAFRRTVEDLFESIEHEPLASGSIAQVHRAIMVIGGHRRSVVVKVRHPGVEVRIKQDFQILKPLAVAASKFKALKGLSLKESLAQFSSTMTAQTDLRVEAAHLRRFFRNFAAVRGSVTPPFPLPDYISDAVLIETFEPGQSVAKYIRNPAPFNTQVVALGVDTYLKMLLTDNFVHTDLHPGNILVRRTDGGELSTEVAAETVRGQLQLILLDFGLAEELTPTVRHHFISFLHMIAAGNGKKAAGHILKWSTNQSCPDPAGFTAAMKDMFKLEAQINTPEGIELDKVMKSTLRIARQFEVSIDSSYAALVIGVVVLVGFATSMDPAVNLMDAAAPAFLQSNLLGKVSGRLYT